MKLFLSCFCFAWLYAGLAMAEPYAVIQDQSRIEFQGTHAGQKFIGTFDDWKADIDFDKDAPEKSKVEIIIDMTSASTGNALYDGTLPQPDWFNTAEYPQAVFTTTSIQNLAPGQYRAEGQLTIKDKTAPVAFEFTLDDQNAASTRMQADLSLDRLAFDIGSKSDPNAEWVSKDMKITINIIAEKAK